MEPEIKTGEFVIIKTVPKYEVQDIITYEENDYLVTHRITNINNDFFVSKGDNNNIEDKKQENSKILGKVVFHSLSIGKFVRIYLKYLIIFIIIFIILRNIYWIIKNNITNEGEDNGCGKYR